MYKCSHFLNYLYRISGFDSFNVCLVFDVIWYFGLKNFSLPVHEIYVWTCSTRSRTKITYILLNWIYKHTQSNGLKYSLVALGVGVGGLNIIKVKINDFWKFFFIFLLDGAWNGWAPAGLVEMPKDQSLVSERKIILDFWLSWSLLL